MSPPTINPTQMAKLMTSFRENKTRLRVPVNDDMFNMIGYAMNVVDIDRRYTGGGMLITA